MLTDREWLEAARDIAQRSPDPTNKVGCVVTVGGFVAAVGFNGPPEEISRTPDLMANREWKYSRTIHAEMRALHRLGLLRGSYERVVLYCTHPPCAGCAPHIVERGIRTVVSEHSAYNLDYRTRWADSVELGRKILSEGWVNYELLPPA